MPDLPYAEASSRQNSRQRAPVRRMGHRPKGGWGGAPSSLLIHLDANNAASYPGSGATWYDIAGSAYSRNFTLVNSPTFSGNSLVFNPGAGYGDGLAITPPFTRIFIGKPIASIPYGATVTYMGAASNYSGANTAQAHQVRNNAWNDFGAQLGDGEPNNYNAALVTGAANYVMMTVTFSADGSSMQYYKNLTLSDTFAVSATARRREGMGTRIYLASGGAVTPTGLDNQQRAEIGVFMVHNKVLTLAEMTTIYNVYKPTYGLP